MDILIAKSFLRALSQFFVVVAGIVGSWAVITGISQGLRLIYVVLIAVSLLAAGLLDVASEIVKRRNLK